MKRELLISVIVPIYKAEPYIRKCINSIINQTYSHFEIILVDDESPDACGAICDEYAEKDDRITVLHQSNQGVSGARNSGLEIARGDYLMFVDSDDYLPPDALFYLVNVANQTNADIVTGKNAGDGSKRFECQQGNFIRLVKDKNQILNRIIFNSYDSVWGKLFKTSTFKNIRFVIGRRINEDVFYSFECILNSCLLAETNYPVYVYLIHDDSACHVSFSEKFYDILFFMEEKIRILKERAPERVDLVSATQFKHYLALLNKMASCRSGYTIEEFYKIRRKVLQYKKAIPQKSRKEQLRLWLIQYCVPLYFAVMRRNK